jgi:hypothetical protein
MFDFDLLFKNYCAITDVPTSKSAEGILWQLLLQLQDYWIWISLGIAFIVTVELLTRHKNEYNSANGYTPEFNRLVGSFSYMLLQLLLYFSIYLIIGNVAYCFPWPYAIHTLVFSLNFMILHGIGFWPEKPKPKKYRKWGRKKKW